MYKKLLFLILLLPSFYQSKATGEPSTYFQIYVPPNNDAVRRDASLIVTAIYDSTYFEIADDGADGDTDDSKTGMLMAGQSYVLYIRDNGINDDARYASGGVLKWDGDYFIVRSNNLVYASQSTNSDWQHDWVPSTDKKSIGKKFIIYSPPFTSSKRDLNVFAYEQNTTVVFQKISFQPKTNTGFTDVNMENPVTIFTRTINIGEDIIYKYTNGRDAMEAGETYLVVADKPITVQYGALFGNERDGGGYVPSSNGSSSGELLYFTVPYQATGEQEIRIVSWDESNAVKLERYNNGAWVTMNTFNLNRMKPADWVGKNNGNISYPTVFRVSCTAGKRVSVFEGNWFETGTPGTSDMATMVAGETGTTSGTRFVTYMAPPGNEQNAVNPFTGTAFGQQMTHLYLFAKEPATVTVKDAFTNGTKFNKTFNLAAERYADCALTLLEWRSIYNGTGTVAGGPERPYLLVESNSPISVMNTNFNDNWMCYTGSSLAQSFTQTSVVSQTSAIPADTINVTSIINTGTAVNNPTVEVIVQDGLKVVDSKLTLPTGTVINGDINTQERNTKVQFDSLPAFQSQTQYAVETQVVASAGANNGNLLNGTSITTVETVVSGTVGGQVQQSSNTQAVNVNTSNTSQLIFSRFYDNLVTKDSTDSWTASWVDINKDGYDDLFVTDRRNNRPNLIYMNNQTGGFTRGQNLAADSAMSMSNTWADTDNDGFIDLLVLNNTRRPNMFYKNNNGLLVRDNSMAFTQSIAYYHGGAFADYDNNGLADLFMCNYFPTKYNELYRNNGNMSFTKEMTNAIPAEANQSVGPSWADYDGDGFQDLFVPNGNGFKNSLFHNEGNGTFSKATTIVSQEGGQSVGSCWGDYDNDGDPDLLVTNSNATGNFLYRNDGSGQFTRVTTGPVVTDKANSHGCSFADIDNDGDLDIYVSNDKNFKLLYLNNGNGTFSKKEDEVICFNYGNAFGHCWSDFDKDGDLDLFAATHSNQPNALFLNNGNTNKWIELSLTGTLSNKSAIGTSVYVYTGNLTQLREVNSQSGFGGMSSLTQHVGLGNAAIIDSIRIKWPSGTLQMLYNVAPNQILQVVEPQSLRVNGVVFFDSNNNGLKDADETLVGRACARLNPGNSRMYTNNEGYFSVNLSPGQYEFILMNENGIISSNGQPVRRTIINGQQVADTVWLPATSSCAGTDLSLLMGSTAIRKGYSNNQMTLVAANNGRQAAATMLVKLKMPATIIPATPTLPFSSTELISENGKALNIYTWSLSNMLPFSSQLIQFQHSNAATVSVGDTITINGWVESGTADCELSNNLVMQTYRVAGAIDPNDIQVSPPGYGPEGYIQPYQALTYTIRFQNLGNHPAMSVRITDQLPKGVDMSTFKLVASGHEGLHTAIEGNKLIFSYDDIMLSDSASNEENSHGFIVFTVMPEKNIPAGTVLKNKASIRFDHYEEMETNEVTNTIQSRAQEESMIWVKSYPNPAGDVIFVSLEHKMGKYTQKLIRRVELLNMIGQLQPTRQSEDNGIVRLELPVGVSGFHLVRVTDNEGAVYTCKVLIWKEK
ncbi:MAG: FG-GAP-like repeat-containing protein [Bacteroidetes bacterium]|nr:FG-GAP-like repeat-containing protein [Bacteroidota bacterium]